MENDQLKVDNQLALIERLSELYDLLALKYTYIHQKQIGSGEVQEALYILLEKIRDLEWMGDLWDVDLSFEEACSLLNGFDFSVVLHPILSGTIIPEDFVFRKKARFKHNGQIWVIHRYDADPFPSNPHAHDIENRIKMDLSNGDCYKKKTFIHRIRKKELLEIRESAENVFKDALPPLTI